jgi:hypothetical protein
MHGRIRSRASRGNGSTLPRFEATFGAGQRRPRPLSRSWPARCRSKGCAYLAVDDRPGQPAPARSPPRPRGGMAPALARVDADEAMGLLRARRRVGRPLPGGSSSTPARHCPGQVGFALKPRAFRQDARFAAIRILLLQQRWASARRQALRCRRHRHRAALPHQSRCRTADLKDAVGGGCMGTHPGVSPIRLVTRHALQRRAVPAAGAQSRRTPRTAPWTLGPAAAIPLDRGGPAESLARHRYPVDILLGPPPPSKGISCCCRSWSGSSPAHLAAAAAERIDRRPRPWRRGRPSSGRPTRIRTNVRGVRSALFGAAPAVQVLGRLEVLGGLGDLKAASARRARQSSKRKWGAWCAPLHEALRAGPGEKTPNAHTWIAEDGPGGRASCSRPP